MRNWKTTSMGILAIVGGVVKIIFAIKSGQITEEDITTSFATIITGIGLLFAKDFNVTHSLQTEKEPEPPTPPIKP